MPHQIKVGNRALPGGERIFPAAPRLRHVWPPVALAYGLPTCRGGGDHALGPCQASYAWRSRRTVDVRCTRGEHLALTP